MKYPDEQIKVWMIRCQFSKEFWQNLKKDYVIIYMNEEIRFGQFDRNGETVVKDKVK